MVFVALQPHRHTLPPAVSSRLFVDVVAVAPIQSTRCRLVVRCRRGDNYPHLLRNAVMPMYGLLDHPVNLIPTRVVGELVSGCLPRSRSSQFKTSTSSFVSLS